MQGSVGMVKRICVDKDVEKKKPLDIVEGKGSLV
jgi:hypothetical protein